MKNKIFLAVLIIGIIILLQFTCYLKKKSFHELLNPNDYNIEFNEKKYIPTKNIDKYYKIVNNGFKVMKTKKIVIGGLFQNSGNKFNKFKKRINNLKKYFADVQIVIFENDSKDNSRVLLLNWQNEQNNVHIIKCKNNSFCLLNEISAIENGTFSIKRMKKMSIYRNYVKKYVDDHFSDYDYFMVIDTDAGGGFSLNGMAYSFGVNKDWDLMSAYGMSGIVLTFGKLLYYDSLAIYDYKSNFINFLKKLFEIHFKNINDDLIHVDNAFGGMTIYKMSSIRNVNYTPHDNNYICEHTIFSNNMKLNGYNKFYINPKLIFLVGKQGKDNLLFY